MRVYNEKPLSEVHKELSKEDLERDITDLEINAIEQEQEITDHDIAIMELQEKVKEA